MRPDAVTILGIDGALGAFSVSVARGERVVRSASATGNVALEAGLSMLANVLAEAEVRAAAIDRLAVGCGPGTFTGLRIAITYAKSLAQAWGLALVPINSFDLLEHGQQFDRILTVVAGRPGVISARFRHGPESRRASGLIEDVLAELAYDASAPLPVLGASKDVLAALAERGTVVRPVDPLVTPAAAVAALAAASRAPARSPHEVRADYGERPAAKLPHPQR